MVKWEYKRVTFGGVDKGKKYYRIARDIDTGDELHSLEGRLELLTWLGCDGWELITKEDNDIFIFKRPVSED